MAASSPAPERSKAQPSAERRRSPRHLCSHLVEISCAGQTSTGLLEDLSPEGAGIAVEFQAARDEMIELTAQGLHATGRVRYCNQRETDFRLGLEFTGGYRWSAEDWQPDHLFLPPPARLDR
jgi:PilZ domain